MPHIKTHAAYIFAQQKRADEYGTGEKVQSANELQSDSGGA